MLIVTVRLALMSWERNRLQRFIGPKIRALFGLGRTDPRIKINPPSNKAHKTAMMRPFARDLVCATRINFTLRTAQIIGFAICAKFILR